MSHNKRPIVMTVAIADRELQLLPQSLQAYNHKHPQVYGYKELTN